MPKTVTVSELVAARKMKQAELEIISKKIKIVRKEIRDINKKIQENLDNFMRSGQVDKEISTNTFGFDYKIKEQLEEEQKGNLMDLIKHG